MSFATTFEMCGYHLRHALRSLSSTPAFTFVMELSLGFGLALWTVARTGNDAQDKVYLERPETVYHVELRRDEMVRPPKHPDSGFWDHIDQFLIAYKDARAIVESSPYPHTISFATPLLVAIPGKDPVSRPVRFTTAPLFAMFERTLVAGKAWNDGDDPTGCVLTRTLANELFASPAAALGQTVTVGGRPFTVLGVTHDDHTIRRFYDYTAYPDTDTMFVPLAALDAVQAYPLTFIPWSRQSGSYESFLGSEIGFLHAFVELPDAKAVSTYQAYVDDYIKRQHDMGRSPQLAQAEIRPLLDWVQVLTAQPYIVFQLFGLLGFVACLFNLVRLLTAKFSARAHEVAIRRALGAPKRSIFIQHLVEAELVAIGGTVLGLTFACAGLAMLNAVLPDRPVDFVLDIRRASLATCACFLGGFVAGFYPALRICNVPPATVLRKQT